MSLTTRFTYGTKNYDFRRPILGNRNDIAFQRINRRTRGGDLIIYRDTEWPKTETLNLTFDFDRDEVMKAFLVMLRETAGNFIYYRDHENRLWYGLIQNPDAKATQEGRSTYKISIIFEGDQA